MGFFSPKHDYHSLKISSKGLLIFILLYLLLFFGCYTIIMKEAERPQQALKNIKFFYPSFSDDMDINSLARAMTKNLEYLESLDPDQNIIFGNNAFTCRQMIETQQTFLLLIQGVRNDNDLKRQIKKHFRLYKATGRSGNRRVLFTGYFEPTYDASLTPDEIYRYPIYRIPDNLIRIDLSLFNEKYRNEMITGRIEGNNVYPYYTRMQIEDEKALHGRNLEIAWLKDPLDVAFLHIQGSGRLRLPDESILPVGYMTSNGRPYRSIGRYMLDKGYLTREEMSMQSIRSYLSNHPGIINEVLNYNPSYIFFKELKDGPYGNIDVPLTPGRSIALDYRLFPKGALCFISSKKPILKEDGEIEKWTDFSRFVLNQDTGGAIRGAGRVDIFWGNNKYAEIAAGHMKHEGELYVLIKRQ